VVDLTADCNVLTGFSVKPVPKLLQGSQVAVSALIQQLVGKLINSPDALIGGFAAIKRSFDSR